MILAKFNTSEQITESSWRDIWEEKLFPEDATIKEIKEWYKSKSKGRFQIYLSEPEIDSDSLA